jgi:hypothetical protein
MPLVEMNFLNDIMVYLPRDYQTQIEASGSGKTVKQP